MPDIKYGAIQNDMFGLCPIQKYGAIQEDLVADMNGLHTNVDVTLL